MTSASPVSDPRRGVLLVAGAALLWSSSGLFIKALPQGAAQIVFVRSLVAALTIVGVLRLRRAHAPLRLDPLTLAAAAAYAGLLAFFVAGTKLTTAANAIFLQFTAPIYLVFLEPWLFRRRIAGRDLAAVALCLGGISLFFIGRLEPGQLAGNLLGLASGLCLALFTLLMKLKRERDPGTDPIGAAVLGNLLVALIFAPVALPGLRATLPQSLALLYLGVFQIGIAYLLFNAGMRHLTATASVVVATLEAVLNPVWVFLGLGERPSPWALLGGVVVIGVIAWYGLAGSTEAKGAVIPEG
jgi:drug/metabolite transporter (DMT)-like permease